jgi:YVTN family beta-propeller protein
MNKLASLMFFFTLSGAYRQTPRLNLIPQPVEIKHFLSLLKALCLFSAITLFFTVSLNSQSLNVIESHRVTLPNGWKLTPVGKLLPLGDLPLNIAISPSKKIAAVTNNGESDQTIQLFDIEKEVLLDSIIIGKSWLGLAFSDDGKLLYASGGNDNLIIRYSVKNNRLSVFDSITVGKPWPVKISVAGLAVDDTKNRLYAVTKENNSLYVIDTRSKKVLSQHPLGAEGYTCLLAPDRKILYISSWGGSEIILFDTSLGKITRSVAVGSHPNDMCITKNGQYLFVSNADDNTVSVVDTRKLSVTETLNTALYANSAAGSTTNSVALSSDEKNLYIANADNNCLAVYDISVTGASKSKGFIPAGWYPTCVRVVKNKILITNGKGITSKANPYGPDPTRKGGAVIYQADGSEQKIKDQYIGGLFRGTLQILNAPDEKQMAVFSGAVYNNTPYIKENEMTSEAAEGNPVPGRIGDPSPIKHIFYIIKENRTYDQVLGDLPQGNGDTKLVLFGEKITPNQHALATEFVLLDNFYVNGEVSADGHNWTMGAYATDFLEKTWPTSYGGRGGSYPGEGSRIIANNKNGFIWDYCMRSGVSYRTYAEFMGDKKPNIPALKGHFCPGYSSWDMSVRDTTRFSQWKHDFDSLMAINAVPQLTTLRFGNDHTEGLSLNKPTPFAHVADNDLAVGMFVDYLSHSPLWKSSLILIVEDDAQNGPDHVDAHRSPAYLAGGFVKKGFVDHTAYTTASFLRTIELILGLPPMSQYDAAAVPVWRSLNNTPDHPVFNSRPSNIDLDLKNLAENKWQKMSEQFDFSKEDMINDADFNEVLWKAVKGFDSLCPPAVHAAFFIPVETEDED